MNWIMIPFNCAIVFGFFYKLAELLVHRRERLMLVEKIIELKDIDLSKFYFYNSGNKYTALRIGCCIVGVGLGFLVGFIINNIATYGDYSQNFNNNSMFNYNNYVAGIVYVACICIFGGCGLIISYNKERRAEMSQQEIKEQK